MSWRIQNILIDNSEDFYKIDVVKYGAKLKIWIEKSLAVITILFSSKKKKRSLSKVRYFYESDIIHSFFIKEI